MTTPITLSPKPLKWAASQICPVDLTQGFEAPEVVCFYHDLYSTEGASAAVPSAPYGVIVSDEKGLRQVKPGTASREALVGLATLASSAEHISPFSWAADASDELNNLFRVFYYRSCTILTWGCMQIGLGTMDEMEASDYASLCADDIFLNLHCANPGSRHQQIAMEGELIRDLEHHRRWVETETERDVILTPGPYLNPPHI